MLVGSPENFTQYLTILSTSPDSFRVATLSRMVPDSHKPCARALEMNEIRHQRQSLQTEFEKRGHSGYAKEHNQTEFNTGLLLVLILRPEKAVVKEFLPKVKAGLR